VGGDGGQASPAPVEAGGGQARLPESYKRERERERGYRRGEDKEGVREMRGQGSEVRR
jgi:hypothetical protein